MVKKSIALILFGILLFGKIIMLNAQTKTITGNVYNAATQNPIPGVSVVVKGTTLGTITNQEGEYLLNVPQKANVLVFSFIGMKTKEQQIKGTEMEVFLEPEYIGLEEVIILGYTKKERNELTGSVVQINGEAIDGIPVASFDQTLQGKVPGLVISSTSGTPGSFHDIRIRGVGSVTAGNEPLFVIDGVPIINEDVRGDDNQSSFSMLTALNSNDIESITILKDASATSVYGARGSNGVIVVTTKKGSPGKTRFTASASYGFQNDAVKGLKPLTGEQKSELLQEAAYNTFGSIYGFDEDDAYDFLSNVLNVTALKNWNGESANWHKLLQNRNAPVQNYHLAASGGDEISSFYASLGFNDTEATVFGANFKRFSSKFNYNRNLSASIRFSTNISISNINQRGITEPSLYFRNPHMTKYFMSPWIQPYLEDGTTLNTNLPTSIFNTLYTIENDILRNDLTRGIANSFIEWMITPGFRMKSLFAVDYSISAYHNYVNRVHGDGVSAGGFTRQSVSRNFNFVSQNSFNYTFNVDKHTFTVDAILEYQENKYNFLSGYGENFPLDGLTYLTHAASNFEAGSFFSDWKNISYIGMVNYDFSKKYIFNYSYRSEGSSKFAPEMRFGNFWSAGTAWNIDKEDFLSEHEIIDVLRVKASYGLSGNSAIGINQYQTFLAFDMNYAGEGAIYSSQFGNNALAWEKNKMLNLGVDYVFLKDRVRGSFAYYHKKTFDLLQSVPLTGTTGHESVVMNAGTIVNKGVEAGIDLKIVSTSDFLFGISANIATVNNQVTGLASDAEGNEINIETTSQKVAIGHPVFGWYMREWAGVNPDTGNAQWYLSGRGSKITENYYDPDIEKAWVGSPIPKYTGGMALHTEYKGFFADAAFYFAGGHKIYEDFSFYTHHSGIYATQYYNGVETMMQRWQTPGDETDVPKVVYGINDDSNTSSRFLYDGDYVRLKDLVLGYRIPGQLTDEIGFDEITLTARGTNILTWVKDERLEFDPEVPASGFTVFYTPPVKSVVFGVNLKF